MPQLLLNPLMMNGDHIRITLMPKIEFSGGVAWGYEKHPDDTEDSESGQTPDSHASHVKKTVTLW